MMSRYIDANEAEKWLKAGCAYVIWDLPRFELTRCKDCIYYEALGYDAPKDGWCNTPKLYCDGFWVDEDDFCSDAKKEETNES